MFADTNSIAEPVVIQRFWNQGGQEKGLAARFSETASEYFLIIPVPGVDQQDLSVDLAGNQIRIALRRRHGAGNPLWPNDEWEQQIELPLDADAIMTQATYRGGELCIRIPRSVAADQQMEMKVYVY